MTEYLPKIPVNLLAWALFFHICLPVCQPCAAAEKAIGATNTPALISIPAGCYQMGDNFGDGYFNEKPTHEVCVNDFAMGKHPITKGEFSIFVAATSYRSEAEKNDGCFIYEQTAWRKDAAANWRFPGFTQGDNHPVVCVSWNDAAAYAQWLSNTNNRAYRLPTEAEWEYAARSGGKRERFAGGNEPDAVAWYANNSGYQTHASGLKNPNGLGLHDMSGNVWQWTSDWYGEHYYRVSDRDNPKGPNTGASRVFRGGSWFYDQQGIRTSYRDFSLPSYRSSYLGFRLVAPVKADK